MGKGMGGVGGGVGKCVGGDKERCVGSDVGECGSVLACGERMWGEEWGRCREVD